MNYTSIVLVIVQYVSIDCGWHLSQTLLYLCLFSLHVIEYYGWLLHWSGRCIHYIWRLCIEGQCCIFIRSFLYTHSKSFSVTVKNDIAVVVCYTGWADVQWWCTLSTHGIGNASHLRWFYRVSCDFTCQHTLCCRIVPILLTYCPGPTCLSNLVHRPSPLCSIDFFGLAQPISLTSLQLEYHYIFF